jgi:uncharacterized protein (TIGR04255 family)
VTPIRIDDPFEESRVAEVRLDRSPLEVVLFQVRFPSPVTLIERALVAGEIAQALSSDYPFADRQEVVEFVMQPGHMPSAQKSANSTAMSLSDASQGWTLNVAKDSVSLTTTAYLHRDDLLARATVIFETLSEVARPPAVSRVGLRYINRINDVERVQKLCGNEGLAEPIRQQQEFSLANKGIQSSLSELQYAWTADQRLQARWGLLPAGQSVANPLAPLSNKSWLLDIDAFDESRCEFSPEIVVDRLKTLSEKAYRFFRWFFTPEALPEFGAVQ